MEKKELIYSLPGVDRVFLFHIRKNAGTSLIRGVKRAYPLSYVRIKRGFSSPALQREDLIGEPAQLDPHHVRRRAGSGKGTELVVGHMNFGIHEVLPGRSMYVAFVRNPISRIVSLYENHKRGRPERVTVNGRTMSLMEFHGSTGDDPQGDIFNEQSKVLAGQFFYEGDLCVERCPEGLAERALLHVEKKIFFTGIHEHMDESLTILKAMLGLDRLNVGHENRGGYAADAGSVSGGDRKILQRLHEADCELYDAALRQYHRLAARLRSIEDPRRIREIALEHIASTGGDESGGGPVPPIGLGAAAEVC